jgi:hypothetical protein
LAQFVMCNNIYRSLFAAYSAYSFAEVSLGEMAEYFVYARNVLMMGWIMKIAYKSFGVNPVCLATFASITGPISSLS